MKENGKSVDDIIRHEHHPHTDLNSTLKYKMYKKNNKWPKNLE